MSLGHLLRWQRGFISLVILIFGSSACGSFAVGTNSDRTVFTNYLEMLHSVAVSGTTGLELSFDTNSFLLASKDVFANGAAEIRGKSFLALVSDGKPGGRPESTICPIKVNLCFKSNGDVCIDFRWKTNEVSSDEYKLLRKRIEFYLNSRLAGHTSNYVHAAIQESKGTNYILPPGFPVILKQQFWIPSKWIPKHPLGDFLRGGNYWVIRDGGYAWVYRSFGFPQKRDPQEYDPRLKNQFKAAREEASRKLDKLGIHPVDSNYPLHLEMQKILKKRFNIDWTTPEEINSEYDF